MRSRGLGRQNEIWRQNGGDLGGEGVPFYKISDFDDGAVDFGKDFFSFCGGFEFVESLESFSCHILGVWW